LAAHDLDITDADPPPSDIHAAAGWNEYGLVDLLMDERSAAGEAIHDADDGWL